MKKVFTLFFLIFIPTLTFAKSSFFVDEKVNIATKENSNLFILSNNVEVNNDVNGNIYAGGNKIIISGNINGDLFLAGNEITINGTVLGNIHSASAFLTINSNVKGDIYSASTIFEIGENALLEGEVYFASNEAKILGNNTENTFGAVENLNIEGNISKDLNIITNNLNFGEKGKIRGNLNIKSSSLDTQKIDPKVDGYINFNKITLQDHTKETLSRVFTGSFSMGVFLITLLLSLTLPNLFSVVAEKIYENPTSNFLYGFLIQILWIISILVSILVIPVLWPLTILLSFGLFIINIIFYPLFGFALFVYFKKPESLSKTSIFVYSILGIIIIKLISSIPYIGDLFNIIIFIMFFGALFKFKIEIFERLRRSSLI